MKAAGIAAFVSACVLLSTASIANADETQTQTAPAAPTTSQVAPAAEGNAKQPASQDLEEATPTPSAQDAETDQARAALKAVIDQVSNKVVDKDYYPAWRTSGVEAELTTAKSVYDDQSATAADINDEAATLTTAFKTATAVYSYEVWMYINNAPHLIRDPYTAESLAVYDAAISKGHTDVWDSTVTQATLDADAQAIQKALDNLKYTETAWKGFLQTAVNNAYGSNYKQGDYTPDSWKAFDAARAAGKAALQSGPQSGSSYEALDNQLKAAVAGLKKAAAPAPGPQQTPNKGQQNAGNKAKGGKLANTGSNVAVVALVMFAALAAAGSLSLLRKRV